MQRCITIAADRLPLQLQTVMQLRSSGVRVHMVASFTLQKMPHRFGVKTVGVWQDHKTSNPHTDTLQGLTTTFCKPHPLDDEAAGSLAAQDAHAHLWY